MLFGTEKPQESATKRVLMYVAVFLFTAGVYTYVQAVPMFRDPDSFYHIKMAMLIRDHGIVRSFPWLPFTTLAQDYADHHFLYHILLIPFVTLLGPFIGMVAATVFFGAAAITLFYGMLRAYGVRHAWIYSYILALSGSFSFRVNLAKTSAISLAMLFIALIAVRKDKPWVLFGLSWLFVLLYGGWPLLAVIVVTFMIARATADWLFDSHPHRSWADWAFWKRLLGGSRNGWREFFAAPEARAACATFAGLSCGIILNPYFPVNLRFYWDQIVQIAVIGYRDTIGVGGEWYPYPFDRLLGDSSEIFLLLLIALLLMAFMLCWPDVVRKGRGSIKRSEMTPVIALTVLASLFLAMTLRSKRHVEYLAPFATFLIALLVDSSVHRIDFAKLRVKLEEFVPKPKVTLPAAVIYLAALFIYMGGRDIYLTASLYREGVPWTRYASATAWLESHAPAGAIVFHSNWDEFPPLFLRDDRARYIIGLDPTFMYLKDPVRYRLWVDVTTGKVQKGAAALVRRQFGAKYVIISKGHDDMRKAFAGDKDAVSVYKDDDAEIFSIL